MNTDPSNSKTETSASSSPDASDALTTEKVTSSPDSAAKPKRKRRLRIWVAAIAGVLLVAFGVPWIQHSLSTVSTDDAYVNSYVTFVAPRVPGQVLQVLVDDNNRVNKGDVLVRLDPEPFQVQVAIRQAAVDAAQASLVVAEATVRSQLGLARGYRFKLQHAIEDVDNQVALLRARAATLEQSKATATLAQAEFDRASKLRATNVTSAEEFDQKREAFDVARAQVHQALENVYQARAALGLPSDPGQGKSLTDVPPDLDQTFSTVRQALAELMQAVAQLGFIPSSSPWSAEKSC
jgi:membrane fusion protein, multidrug efflux system